MKTIEEAAFDEYQINRNLPKKYWIPDVCYMDWFKKGVEFAQRWISVEEEKIPDNMDNNLLLKLESGKIFRFEEEWEDEREIVTHWRYIELK
jgi:hypothetical protein